MTELGVEATAEGDSQFEVQVTPRASRSQLLGVHDGALKLSLKAPPVDGAANAELLRFLAKTLGVAKRDVRLVRGQSSRRKTVRVGLAPEQVLALLAPRLSDRA